MRQKTLTAINKDLSSWTLKVLSRSNTTNMFVGSALTLANNLLSWYSGTK